MTSPADIVRFHADYDIHTDDRVRLFDAVRTLVRPDGRVLYPGSYVDIGPSVWFDDVIYVDSDKRTPTFFGTGDELIDFVIAKRTSAGAPTASRPSITFHHADYREPLPIDDESIDLLVSMYAGFVSEHCSRYLRPGGFLLANNSHGDASMASLDKRFALAGVVQSTGGAYQLKTHDLDRHLQPKRGQSPTRADLHASNRGIAYTTSPFAYVFRFG